MRVMPVIGPNSFCAPLMAKPAYGRKYTTLKEAQDDWKAGKDFYNEETGYFSIRDSQALEREFNVYLVWTP